MTLNKTKIQKIFALLIICITINASAQVTDTTLAGQYEDVVIKSGSYKVYKNIRKTKIEQLWKNVTDSLQKEKALADKSKLMLAQQSDSIANLRAELKNLTGSGFSGIKTEDLVPGKSAKLWGLIILLGAALFFVMYRSRAALKEAVYRNTLYNELVEEFHKYKSHANEKERKLARELQTERNRVDELMGKKS